MKALFAIAITFILSVSLGKSVYAQSEDTRTTIKMTLTFGGKTVTTDLNSVSTSLSRSTDEIPAVEIAKDSVKTKTMMYNPNASYLTFEVKNISDELLTIFAKKKNLFDGTITIVDTYGKIPTRTIKFKKAGLYNYSDQISGGIYSGDSYSSAAVSISCKELSINGILIEQ